MLTNKETCRCGHYKEDHVDYGYKDMGPYCIVKKCQCYLYTRKALDYATTAKGTCLLAIERLKQDGWSRTWLIGPNGERDITTAILSACGWKKDVERKVLEKLFTIIQEPLVVWNAAKDRTMEDCIELLKLGADLFDDEDDTPRDAVAATSDAGNPELSDEGCS